MVVTLLLAGLSAGCGPTTEAAGRSLGGAESTAASEITPVELTPITAGASTQVPTASPVVVVTLTAAPGPVNTPSTAPTIDAEPTATRAPTAAPTATPGAALVEPLLATSGTEVVSPALVERGMQVYQKFYCGVCHQLDAAHTAGKFGPTHNHMGTTAELRIRDTTYTGTAKTAAEYIRESIISPQVYIVAGYEHSQYHMPAFAQLGDADLNALVQMLLQQK